MPLEPLTTPDEVAALAAAILDPARGEPIVCLTSRPQDRCSVELAVAGHHDREDIPE
jgi:hypothetical protein